MTRHERLHDRSDLNEWFSNSTVPTRSFVILKNSRKIGNQGFTVSLFTEQFQLVQEDKSCTGIGVPILHPEF